MKKSYSLTGRACRVTFALHPADSVQTAAVCGEFNDWNPTVHRMKRRKDGGFSVTLSLPSGHQYRFRYLLDSVHWTNDATADASVANPFGSEDSVVQV